MEQKISDRELYPAVWITLILLGIGYSIWRYVLNMPTISSCWIWNNWHIYCPGCGGTRRLIALLQGDILGSFYYHPALPILATVLGAYMVSQTIWRLRRRQGCVLHYHHSWAPGIVVILLVNCVIRNILLLGFGIAIA